MAIHVPSSQLPEIYMPDWTSINQKLASTNQANAQTNLLESKDRREQAKENALAQYMKTGDRNALLAVDPSTALALDKEDRANRLGDATLAAKQQELKLRQLEWLQKSIPGLTLQTYPLLAKQAQDMGIVTAFKDPSQVTQQDIDQLKAGAMSFADQIKLSMDQTRLGMEQELQPGKVQSQQLDITNKQKPTYNQIQQGDQTVTTRWTPQSGEQMVGTGPKWNESGMFFKTTLHDGTPIEFGTAKGKTGASTQAGMQQTTTRKIEEQLVADLGTLSDLSQISNTYESGMQTFKEKASNVWTATKDKLGVGTVTPEQEADLKKITVFRQNAIKNMNNYIKNITGAALSEKEADRIRQGMPDPGLGMMNGLFSGDSDIEFKAKLDQSTALAKRAVWKGNYMRKYGLSIQNMPDVDSPEFTELMRSEQMKPIINERGTQIYNQVRQSNPGMGDAELQKETQARLANDLGLAY